MTSLKIRHTHTVVVHDVLHTRSRLVPNSIWLPALVSRLAPSSPRASSLPSRLGLLRGDLRRAVPGVDVDRRRRREHLLHHPAVLEGTLLLARQVEVVVRPPGDA